jgi:hypothetical protein
MTEDTNVRYLFVVGVKHDNGNGKLFAFVADANFTSLHFTQPSALHFTVTALSATALPH